MDALALLQQIHKIVRLFLAPEGPSSILWVQTPSLGLIQVQFSYKNPSWWSRNIALPFSLWAPFPLSLRITPLKTPQASTPIQCRCGKTEAHTGKELSHDTKYRAGLGLGRGGAGPGSCCCTVLVPVTSFHQQKRKNNKHLSNTLKEIVKGGPIWPTWDHDCTATPPYTEALSQAIKGKKEHLGLGRQQCTAPKS